MTALSATVADLDLPLLSPRLFARHAGNVTDA